MSQISTQSSEPARRWSTLALLEKPEKSGVNREAATALVEAFEESHEHQNATKADLKETEHRLQLEIEKVSGEIKNVRREIAEIESRLIKWVIGMGGVIIAVLGFLITFS